MSVKRVTIDIISDVVWPFCWIGKRKLESALSTFDSKTVDFKVKWLPFQLNPHASQSGSNKVEMYMQKFGRSKQQVMAMAEHMGQNFASVGLPYKFTDQSLVGNTFNAHRVTSYAYTKGGATMQDTLVEELFQNYFAEEKFMNDPAVLVAAAVKAGMPENEAKQVVADAKVFAVETRAELQHARDLNVRGVPYFVITGKNGSKAISGAQDPSVFITAIQRVS